MLVDALPARLVFWLGRPVRLERVSAAPEVEAATENAARPAGERTVMRPAIDLETRLILRDRGWNPDV